MNIDKNSELKTEVLDAWIEYMEIFGAETPSFKDLLNLGYSYEETLQIFRQAVLTQKAIDAEILKIKA